MPEHWFNFTTVFNLLTDKLTATTSFKVVGSAEDPNRLVEYRDMYYDEEGHPVSTVRVHSADAVFDKIPPIADLTVGLTWTPVSSMLIRATVYKRAGAAQLPGRRFLRLRAARRVPAEPLRRRSRVRLGDVSVLTQREDPGAESAQR